MTGPSFIEQMVTELRTHETSGYFRWFDSGDVQSVQMALDILEAVEGTRRVAGACSRVRGGLR